MTNNTNSLKLNLASERIDRPRFLQGTVITTRSLVTDENGVAWWVDPDKRLVERLSVGMTDAGHPMTFSEDEALTRS